MKLRTQRGSLTAMSPKPNIIVLCGGIGGVKLVQGLASFSNDIELTVIGNIGDDAEFHGLWVSPDMDTVIYTLAGCVNIEPVGVGPMKPKTRWVFLPIWGLKPG